MARRYKGARRPRMSKFWSNSFRESDGLAQITLQADFPLATPVGTQIFQNTVTQPFDDDVTILRSYLSGYHRPSITGSGNVNSAMGIAIVPPGSDVSSLNPVTNASWDGWYMHRWLAVNSFPIAQAGGQTAIGIAQGSDASHFIDSKAKRRIPQGSVVVVSYAAELVSAVGADLETDFTFTLRTLIGER